MDYSTCTAELDKIASSLESQGLTAEALQIDVIANTIEAGNALDTKLRSNPLLRGSLIEDPKKAIKDLKGMTDGELQQAMKAIMDPEYAKSLMQGKDKQASNILDNVRSLGSALKEISGKISVLSPLINEIGYSSAEVLKNIAEDGISNPRTILSLVVGVNGMISTLFKSLTDDGRIDAREARELAPMVSELMGKFGIRIHWKKISPILQKIDFTSKMIADFGGAGDPALAVLASEED